MFSRRSFLLGLLSLTTLKALDFHKTHPGAWEKSTLNDAALALYGAKKFSTIRKSTDVELVAPKHIVRDQENIPIGIKSTIMARSVAIFQDANPKSLVAVFNIHNNDPVDFELNIKMEFKGTLFAVVEDTHGQLHYTRAFIDVLCLPCVTGTE